MIKKTIKGNLKDTIEVYVLLLLLGGIMEAVGTTFFGVNLLPLIIIIIVIAIIVDEYKDNKKTIDDVIKWIKHIRK